ncbi:MAG: ABC transporter ATP-binding protein [Clostridia bacterium]|nr:ABC transporter ATP-binding protein [Clostridia bacterium]
MSFIELKHVYKQYKMGEITIKALDGISFGIEQGELALVVGPSGAGKTTVLNILGGIDNCDDGVVRVGGENIANFSSRRLSVYRRQDVGFVFQFYNLVPNLTAFENVELAAALSSRGLSPRRMLERVGLSKRMDNFPSQLSGGEQQRVAIARALAKNPKLLLCDEPTGALDTGTGKQILELLQNTSLETGMTVVIITHNTSLTPMADRVITMKSGRLQRIAINDNPLPVKRLEW